MLRPEGAVGEAEIVGLALGLGQVGDGIGDLAALRRAAARWRSSLTAAAPAEPEPATALQRLAQRDRQPARRHLLLTDREW